jgi:hypothetical protein
VTATVLPLQISARPIEIARISVHFCPNGGVSGDFPSGVMFYFSKVLKNILLETIVAYGYHVLVIFTVIPILR